MEDLISPKRGQLVKITKIEGNLTTEDMAKRIVTILVIEEMVRKKMTILAMEAMSEAKDDGNLAKILTTK